MSDRIGEHSQKRDHLTVPQERTLSYLRRAGGYGIGTYRLARALGALKRHGAVMISADGKRAFITDKGHDLYERREIQKFAAELRTEREGDRE